MNTSNFFARFLKNLSKSINSLLEKYLNKLNINNFKRLLLNNKIFFTIVAAIILFFSYISLPNIYNQDKISKEIQSNLFNKLNLEFNFSNELEYKFLPRPHFVTKESSIINDENKISEIKTTKIYVSLENLFSLENMKVTDVVLEEANFNLNKNNYNFFFKLLNANFKESKLQITNSNIFYRNYENDVLLINNIFNSKYYYDPNELKNIFYSENEIFNVPYSLEIFTDENDKTIYSKINLESFRLQLDNKLSLGKDFNLGSTEFSFLNQKSIAKYKTNKNFFEFSFNDKSQALKFLLNGKFNFKPFYSYLEGKVNEINFTSFFSSNAIIKDLLKTEILNNKNIDFKLDIKAEEIKNFDSFKNIFLKSKIHEGLIDFDQTKFSWKNNVNFELKDSLVYVRDGQLILDGSTELAVINSNEVYKFLLTPKKLRKQINKININFTYFFDEKIIKIKNILVDGKLNKKLNDNLRIIYLKDDNLQNKIYFKNLLNDAIKNYAG